MNFQELKQHAEETGKAVLASTMEPGQMAVVLSWGMDYMLPCSVDRSAGALVVRVARGDTKLVTVKPSPEYNYPHRGTGWNETQLGEVTVLILNPEFPFEVQQ